MKIEFPRYLTPSSLMDRCADVIDTDPGTERKVMLVYVDGREAAIVSIESEARVFSMHLTTKPIKIAKMRIN